MGLTFSDGFYATLGRIGGELAALGGFLLILAVIAAIWIPIEVRREAQKRRDRESRP